MSMHKRHYFIFLFLFIASLLIASPFFLNAVGSTTFELVINESSTPVVTPGGGSALAPVNPLAGSLAIAGRSAPGVVISITRDGEQVGAIAADSEGNFRATFSNINPGTYTIGVQSSKDGDVGRLTVFAVTVDSGQTYSLDVGTIPPIVSIRRSLTSSRSIVVYGLSIPRSQHVVAVRDQASNPVEQYLVVTDELGEFEKEIDLDNYNEGVYIAHIAPQQESDRFSSQQFLVGQKGVVQKDLLCKRADLNCDQKVNLVDFSIAAFWYGKVLSENMREVEFVRLNGDGKIDLVDFSIMAFYWHD